MSSTEHYFTPRFSPLDPEKLRWTTVLLRGRELNLATGAGVFARDGLDAGSRLLLETALPHLSAGAIICDLGCGWGPLICFAAALVPDAKLFACDINPRAVDIARLNAQTNQLNIEFWCGNGLQAAQGASFDTILCNPPVRAGNAAMAELFTDAKRCLKPTGTLWLVIRTAQGAKSWQRRLAAQFGTCETVEMDAGYRVLRCQTD